MTFKWQHFFPTEFLRLNDFLFALLKKDLVGMYNINEKNSNIKSTGRTFPENLNGKLQKLYNKSSYIMSKTSLGKYKRPSKNSKLYKKSKKRIHTRSNFVVVFARKIRCINQHATWGTASDICTSSVTCYTSCKEESGVAGSTFHGG